MAEQNSPAKEGSKKKNKKVNWMDLSQIESCLKKLQETNSLGSKYAKDLLSRKQSLIG